MVERQADELVRTRCQYPKLKAAFYHLPPPLTYEDTEHTMAALQKLVDLLSKADPVRCSYSLRSRATYDLGGLYWGAVCSECQGPVFRGLPQGDHLGS